MSNNDQEELPNNGWFDSESDLPGISSVNSTLAMGVNVSPPSANRHIRALDFGDSSKTSPAPNKGTPVGHAPLKGAGSNNEENFIDAPVHTPPQSKSPSPVRFHCGLPIGRGRGAGR